METKFTKGPWVISTLYNTLMQINSNGVDICEVDCNGDFNEETGIMKSTVEELANAHLIKMAPDMYELLIRFLPMDEDGNGEFEYNDGSEYLGERVEALLAKARGESNEK